MDKLESYYISMLLGTSSKAGAKYNERLNTGLLKTFILNLEIIRAHECLIYLEMKDDIRLFARNLNISLNNTGDDMIFIKDISTEIGGLMSKYPPNINIPINLYDVIIKRF